MGHSLKKSGFSTEMLAKCQVDIALVSKQWLDVQQTWIIIPQAHVCVWLIHLNPISTKLLALLCILLQCRFDCVQWYYQSLSANSCLLLHD